MDLTEFETYRGWEIQDTFYNGLYRKAEHLLNTLQNAIHTRIAYHLALRLLETERGDARIVLPAIILHDIGYSQIPEKELMNAKGIDANIKKPELRRQHEIEGVHLAKKILRDIDYPDELIQMVLACIDGHDTRKTAMGPNDMIVKDADKLWRFTYEGFHIDYIRFEVSPKKWLDDLKSSILEWFFTDTATKMALEKAEKRRIDIQPEA